MIYLIGSLKNPVIPEVAQYLRKRGFEVFDDWHAAGPDADDHWQAYERFRGRPYDEALAGAHAQDVFHFDKRHLDMASMGVLVLPAGKSGHLELGYLIGQGKPGYIVMPGEPKRYDVMYNFASGVFFDLDDMILRIEGDMF